MDAEWMRADARDLADLMRENAPVLVLTGAGISTESGIPDFRSPGTGLWETVDPMEILSATALNSDPKGFYEFKIPLWRGFLSAEPNPAHRALAEMEAMGAISGLVTQNIDSLHARAGSRNVLEVHGHMRTGRCLKCDRHPDFAVLAEKFEGGQCPPRCECGGILRPDVVLFEDMLPDAYLKAMVEASRAGLLLVIGSSLEVAPVNYLPAQAKSLAILNIGPTMYDEDASWIGHYKAGEFLPLVVEELRV